MARAHATLAGLAKRARLQDLAEAATADGTVDAALLEAAIGGDLEDDQDPDYTDEQRAAGTAAVDRLQRHVDDANTEVDGYLSRYPDLTETDDLSVRAYDIALYRVLGGERDSARYERYRAAIRYLEGVSAGDINLDLDEDETDATPAARFTSSKARFRREDLAGL